LDAAGARTASADPRQQLPHRRVEHAARAERRADFEVLKLEVRLCTDLKILPMKEQAEPAALMDGIDREITGRRSAGR